ncbi:hypothetical protein Mth01_55520 [Sphaerimonospora thailandensis]|uniref:Uncharacterized protein n=1 Tax=Sphaerimonospora thailandensis TaxID=795644 RepID=A0A8J3RGI8_9ACTN|nr:hypothetical protein Mth01_55520 [Sphaerimonospora thailandensis]
MEARFPERIESWHVLPPTRPSFASAVRMVAEIRPNYPTEWAAMKAVAAKLGRRRG